VSEGFITRLQMVIGAIGVAGNVEAGEEARRREWILNLEKKHCCCRGSHFWKTNIITDKGRIR